MTTSQIIRTRTPLRISFVGGGSDLPSFYSSRGGAVVSTTIDKYVDVTFEKAAAGVHVQLGENQVQSYARLEEIENKVISTTLAYAQIREPFSLAVRSSVPPGSGLGSSSALIVGLLAAAYAGRNISRDNYQLAQEASYIELELLRSPIGRQDHYACALGGINHLQFGGNSIAAERLPVSSAYLEMFREHLLLLFTGQTRSANAILQSHTRKFLDGDTKAFETTAQIANLVPDFIRALVVGNIKEIGALLHAAWQLKRSVSNGVSTSHIDELYVRALDCGALGGKILGAGGGGYFLFLAPPETHPTIQAELGLEVVPFNFESYGCTLARAEASCRYTKTLP